MNKLNKRNLIIILCVAVLAVLALIVVGSKKKDSTFAQNYHIQNVNTITKIYLADKHGNQSLLEKHPENSADSLWTINGEAIASQPAVDLLLETLHDMRIRQQVNKAAIPTINKNLAAQSIKTEVYQKVYFINWFKGHFRLFPHEKKTVTYYVGNETQDMMGSYMWREGDKVPYIIHIPGFRGFLTPRFITDPLAWQSHRFVDLDIKHIQSVELEIPGMPEESFAIKRNGDGFQFELLQSHTIMNGFDTARVAQLLSSFVNLNFDEFAQAVPKAELDTTFSKAPRTILKVTDIENRTRELKTYIKYNNPEDIYKMPDPEMYDVFDLDRLYAIIDNKDTVLIQYYIFDNILQPASFFLGQGKSEMAK